MGAFFSDMFAFGWLVATHWGAYVTGGAPWVADEALKRLSDGYAQWSERNKPLRRRVEIGALLAGLLFASFQAWQEEHLSRLAAETATINAQKDALRQSGRAEYWRGVANRPEQAAQTAGAPVAPHAPDRTACIRKLEASFQTIQPLMNAYLPKDMNNQDYNTKWAAPVQAWINETGRWIKENMGEAAQAKFDDRSSLATPMPNWNRAIGVEHNTAINYLMMYSKNLETLIQSSAWDGPHARCVH